MLTSELFRDTTRKIEREPMRILLFNPDNGVTRNFMPHLWMFLLKSLTPPEHEVLLIDGNAQRMDEDEIARYVRDQKIDLVGIGAMTRMIQKAYRMADAIRAAGVPVVMGGPHVTEVPGEAVGRDGGPQHADAVALGEADETWPRIVADAACGELKDIYLPVDEAGKDKKPGLDHYPSIPWESMDLDQFNMVPRALAPLLKRAFSGWGSFRLIPVESGRGCPYGCEFCTVTGFFGDSIRFRSNESVDDELVDLIAASGGKWIFIGMESIDTANLAIANKSFNKPDEYEAVLRRLAQRNIHAITSFIFGLDNDTPGAADRTLAQIRNWPPGLPVFGTLIPFPSTPLYKRLEVAGRLTRPKHWLDFQPYKMAHTPLKMTIEETHAEVQHAWASSYSAEAIERAVAGVDEKSIGYRINMFIARLCFRGIYFPQMSKWEWVKLIAQNRRTIFKLFAEAFGNRQGIPEMREGQSQVADAEVPA